MAEQEPMPVEPIESTEPVEVETVEVSWQGLVPPNRPRKVSASMWGPLEIGAVAVSSMAVMAALVAYFFFVIPSNRQLAQNKTDADRLEAEQMSAKSKYGEITSSQDQVGKLLSSVDDFQSRFLPAVTNGQAALYQRLNGLMSSYDLVNTSGPDYAPLETLDMNPGQQQKEEEHGRSKFRSLFPGVYVTVTLEGSYQNLRKFIREIETGHEFVVVSTVELAPSDSEIKKDQTKPNLNAANPNFNPGVVSQPAINPTNGKPMMPPPQTAPKGFPAGPNPGFVQPLAQQPASKKGKMHGEIVSLHIEMAAYFRRTGSAPLSPAPVQQ
ncbi:MAG TPA: hypothetical protein VHQ01_03480 [Pyrinomonadaceae bacterium]|nr:hypothetical protein [Pyrinomonadaceae bacterium]